MRADLRRDLQPVGQSGFDRSDRPGCHQAHPDGGDQTRDPEGTAGYHDPGASSKKAGEAIACDVKYIPYHRGIPLLEKELKNSTFPEMVARKNSIFAITKKLRIFAAGAEEDTARLLNAEEGTPLLAVEEFLYDNHDKPVGWGITYMLGNAMICMRKLLLNSVPDVFPL